MLMVKENCPRLGGVTHTYAHPISRCLLFPLRRLVPLRDCANIFLLAVAGCSAMVDMSATPADITVSPVKSPLNHNAASKEWRNKISPRYIDFRGRKELTHVDWQGRGENEAHEHRQLSVKLAARSFAHTHPRIVSGLEVGNRASLFQISLCAIDITEFTCEKMRAQQNSLAPSTKKRLEVQGGNGGAVQNDGLSL